MTILLTTAAMNIDENFNKNIDDGIDNVINIENINKIDKDDYICNDRGNEYC